MADIDRYTGEIIDNERSALQALDVIFSTRIGSMVLLREFGAGVVEVIGRLVRPELLLVFQQLVITAIDGKEQAHTYAIAPREYRMQYIEGVPQKTVTPSEEQQKRAREESERVWSARQKRFARTDFTTDFIWPLTGRITGVYGSQRIYNGEPRAPHYGVDIARPTGTRVWAPASGQVTLAEPDLFYSGGTLIIDHGHGLSSTFIHLSKLLVKVGDEIKQGDEIAEVGATGRATGPHLDWRMNWLDQRVDPTTLVEPVITDSAGQVTTPPKP